MAGEDREGMGSRSCGEAEGRDWMTRGKMVLGAWGWGRFRRPSAGREGGVPAGRGRPSRGRGSAEDELRTAQRVLGVRSVLGVRRFGRLQKGVRE